MAKMYKTANGKLVDMDTLRLKNEDTIAVGNMRTNARGDELGPGGKVVKNRNEKMNENYKLHTMVPKDDLVHDSLEMATERVAAYKTGTEGPSTYKESSQETALRATANNNFGDVEITDTATVVTNPVSKKPRGGLAASIAKPELKQTVTTPTTIKRI